MQANAASCDVCAVARNGQVLCVACSVERARKRGRSRVADVDDLQAKAVVGHIGVAALNDHARGQPRGVVAAGEHWPLGRIDPSLPVAVATRGVPSFGGDGIAGGAVVARSGLVIHVGAGIGLEHAGAGG